jgi:hypothetical protein
VIEEAVRALVSELAPGTDACTPAERIDRIAALDHTVNLVQAALSVETATYVEQRRLEDIADGVPADSAGRGAAVEIAMARRVSEAAVDHHLTFAQPLLADLPHLLAACLDGAVSQPAAQHIVKACEALDSERRRAIDPELTALATGLTPGQSRKAADRLVASTDPAKLIGHRGGDYGTLPADPARELATSDSAWWRPRHALRRRRPHHGIQRSRRGQVRSPRPRPARLEARGDRRRRRQRHPLDYADGAHLHVEAATRPRRRQRPPARVTRAQTTDESWHGPTAGPATLACCPCPPTPTRAMTWCCRCGVLWSSSGR